MAGAVRVEVGPYAEHDPRPVRAAVGDGEQAVQEVLADPLVVAERKHLLELVDHDHQHDRPGSARQRLPYGQRDGRRVSVEVGMQRRGGDALQCGQLGG